MIGKTREMRVPPAGLDINNNGVVTSSRSYTRVEKGGAKQDG